MIRAELIFELSLVAFTVLFVATKAPAAAALGGISLLSLLALALFARHVPIMLAPRNPTDEELNAIRQQIIELKSDVSRASLAVGLRVRD